MSARRRPFDAFTLTLLGCALLGHVLPARGGLAQLLERLLDVAVFGVFFSNGARLSSTELWAGLRQARLQLSVLMSTFLLFPVLGLALHGAASWLTTPELGAGFLFLCALPSTIQSSIALTALAGGNVPAAICAAATSNVFGVLLTPIWVGVLGLARRGPSAASAGASGSAALIDGVLGVVWQLLLPFGLGHLSRRWTASWVAQHPTALARLDRGTILLVVYTAFSRASVEGLWRDTPPLALAGTALLVLVLLVGVLALTTYLARGLGFAPTEEIVLVFCGSKKSLASGVPIARVLFGAQAASLGALVVPIMLYHQFQLFACAWLAQRYRRRLEAQAVPPMDPPPPQ